MCAQCSRCPTPRDAQNATQVTWSIFQADHTLTEARSWFGSCKNTRNNLQVEIYNILHEFLPCNLQAKKANYLACFSNYNLEKKKKHKPPYKKHTTSNLKVLLTFCCYNNVWKPFLVEDICSYFYMQQLDLSVWISLIRKSVLFFSKLLMKWQMSESRRFRSWIISGKKRKKMQKTAKWATIWLGAMRVSHSPHTNTPPPLQFGTGTTGAQQAFITEIFDLRDTTFIF